MIHLLGDRCHLPQSYHYTSRTYIEMVRLDPKICTSVNQELKVDSRWWAEIKRSLYHGRHLIIFRCFWECDVSICEYSDVRRGAMTKVMGVLRRKPGPAADGKGRGGGGRSACHSRAEEQRGWAHRPAFGKLGGGCSFFLSEYGVTEMLISFSLSVYKHHGCHRWVKNGIFISSWQKNVFGIVLF